MICSSIFISLSIEDQTDKLLQCRRWTLQTVVEKIHIKLTKHTSAFMSIAFQAGLG